MDKPLPVDPIAEGRQLCEQHWGYDTAVTMVALTSVIRAEQLIITELNRILRPFQLTFSRYEALVRLSYSRHESLSLGRLSARLQVHPTSITNTIDRLEAAGLAVRVPLESDRRAMHAAITARGRQVAHNATLALQQQFRLPGLDHADLEQVTAMMSKLRQALGDFGTPGGGDPAAADGSEEELTPVVDAASKVASGRARERAAA